ncbi:hypothetical protein AX17_004705 [Amanita inopinata Kibby_2008]|nr:hypothetical protein AX17_004705 [Amanita inopinata Kibby_2008]
MPLFILGLFCGSFLLFVLYIAWNDRRISDLPQNASFFSPNRVTPAEVISTAARLAKEPPISIKDQIPPKTGRRYIVVGGGGFLGGWIVSQLLDRGEDPRKIRILDISPSSRKDFMTGPATQVQFFKVDMSNRAAVDAAFKAPWPQIGLDGECSEPELTVFQTAANIRFYERHPKLVDRSTRVNVQGTQNIIDSARAVGASVLVYTSSGSICVRRSRFWLWPWEREPPFFVQVINDVDDSVFPKRHDQFFSNYAASKKQAEQLVRLADKSTTTTMGCDGKQGVLRTGCLRPGNGIFGPGDMLCHSYLRRSTNPTWISNTLQSFTYVENCACAHLCYEQRLIELSHKSCKNPDIGGDAFVVADPGPPATYGDVYETMETLTEGDTHFTSLSATTMLLVSHLIECYHLTREVLGVSFPLLQKIIPPIKGDIINLQPSLFALTQVHLVFDDSRARLPPEKGGLGYRGAWTTIEGLHRTYEEHRKGFDNNHNSGSGGVSLGFKFRRKIRKGHRGVADPPRNVPVEVGAAN